MDFFKVKKLLRILRMIVLENYIFVSVKLEDKTCYLEYFRASRLFWICMCEKLRMHKWLLFFFWMMAVNGKGFQFAFHSSSIFCAISEMVCSLKCTFPHFLPFLGTFKVHSLCCQERALLILKAAELYCCKCVKSDLKIVECTFS